MLTLLWLLTAAALCAGLASAVLARRASRRVERLTESYWELRYEAAQLRARLARLEPPPDAGADPEAPAPGGEPAAFVPLSTLKRSP
ncbi:MAG: hypothetical protein IT176_05400 [Acidobacteria bacterium]|nr:hypothetical protein [Acidobacteriota bacterium]